MITSSFFVYGQTPVADEHTGDGGSSPRKGSTEESGITRSGAPVIKSLLQTSPRERNLEVK